MTDRRNTRRLKRIQITRAFVETFLSNEKPFKILNPLPKDTILLHTSYDQLMDKWVLLVTSESFPEVDATVLNEEIPEHTPMFQEVKECKVEKH